MNVYGAMIGFNMRLGQPSQTRAIASGYSRAQLKAWS
jgi:hypothetical protein